MFLSANNAEICQLAAIHGTEQLNVYILPLHGITPTAAAVNRLSVSHGRMFYEGKPVTAVQLDVGIQKFLNWLQSLTEPCLLLAHNAKLFDAKHLLKALKMSSKTEPFSEVVVGFCDTLPAFKELFPERKSYSQENLARDLLESTYNAHNALLLAFQRGGSEALSNVLKEKFNGKARVTRRKKVIMKICDFFKGQSKE